MRVDNNLYVEDKFIVYTRAFIYKKKHLATII